MILDATGFGFEIEVTAKVAKLKCRIFEVPISYYGRTYAEGKKIGMKDGLYALWCILKYNAFVSLKRSFHQLPVLDPTDLDATSTRQRISENHPSIGH
jgi:hypothetical protein